MLTKHLLAATAAIALFATPSMAQTAKPTRKVSSSVQSFVTKAANGGLLEVETSQIASTRSRDEAVRSFAQQMLNDHTKANDELKTIAGNVGATVPTKMNRTHQAQTDKVRKATDARFDQTYITVQAKAHRDAVALFRNYARSGTNADLKSFASRTLPVLEEHQARVTELQNASSATGRSTGSSGAGRAGTSGKSQPAPNGGAPADRNPTNATPQTAPQR